MAKDEKDKLKKVFTCKDCDMVYFAMTQAELDVYTKKSKVEQDKFNTEAFKFHLPHCYTNQRKLKAEADAKADERK